MAKERTDQDVSLPDRFETVPKAKIGGAYVDAVIDLLARTIFYKVGHHGSQNATLKQHGLELMSSPDLSAFIPTNEKDALKVKWGEMPFKTILEDLEKRTSQRVIRADDPWIGQPASKPKFGVPSGAVLALQHDAKKGLWVELDIA